MVAVLANVVRWVVLHSWHRSNRRRSSSVNLASLTLTMQGGRARVHSWPAILVLMTVSAARSETPDNWSVGIHSVMRHLDCRAQKFSGRSDDTFCRRISVMELGISKWREPSQFGSGYSEISRRRNNLGVAGRLLHQSSFGRAGRRPDQLGVN
jgi:hypothetical protein